MLSHAWLHRFNIGANVAPVSCTSMDASLRKRVTRFVRAAIRSGAILGLLLGQAPLAHAQMPAAEPSTGPTDGQMDTTKVSLRDVRVPPRDLGLPLSAQGTNTGGNVEEPSIYDRIWKFAEWYSNDT